MGNLLVDVDIVYWILNFEAFFGENQSTNDFFSTPSSMLWFSKK